MAENCNSRGFSRLMKSCFPDTNQPQQPTSLIRISGKIPPENCSHTQQQQTTFSSLPDDLLLECLTRVPLSSLSSIFLVCRKWSQLIDSFSFHDLRRNRGLIQKEIFAFSLYDYGFHIAHHPIGKESDWETILTRDLYTVASEVLDGPLSHSRLIGIRRYIYIMSRNSTIRYDTWSGGFVCRSPMLFPRKKFAAAEIDGKIYICGGAGRTATVEEYDTNTDTWKIVGESSRRRYGCIGASIDGVFYVIGGLKINNRSESRDGRTEAREYASSMDLYDVETRVWLRSRMVPGGGCVVAACAVGGNLYILTSHAVELSFWRFDGRRKSGGGGGFGEWCRMKSPPLPVQVRVDNTVRFCFVGVGGDKGKVVLVQVMGCIDDLLRRSGRRCRGLKQGLVLVYDLEVGEWGRSVDLPGDIRRAACVCVEC